MLLLRPRPEASPVGHLSPTRQRGCQHSGTWGSALPSCPSPLSTWTLSLSLRACPIPEEQRPPLGLPGLLCVAPSDPALRSGSRQTRREEPRDSSPTRPSPRPPVPGMALSSLALHMWPLRMSVRMYSMRLALHRKLKARRYWLMRSRVNTCGARARGPGRVRRSPAGGTPCSRGGDSWEPLRHLTEPRVSVSPRREDAPRSNTPPLRAETLSLTVAMGPSTW